MTNVINTQGEPDLLNNNNKLDQKSLENIIKSKEVEKQYLEGEIHKEITDNQINENLTEVNNNNIKEEKIPSLKYNFLKDKLSKMQTSETITLGINKSIDKQMKNLQTDIFDNKILMTEVPKQLNNLLSKSLVKSSKDFENKNKLKAIRELQDEKNILNIKLQKIISNEKFLNNEGHMESGLSNRTFSLVDEKVFQSKKKLLGEKKNELMNKIEEIEDKINKIIVTVGGTTRKERLKVYIENFEKDKELIESRAKKYYKEAKERKQRITNDLNNKADKIKKELNEKTKEEELKKAEILKKLKDQEKATVQKRTKINDEKANMFKPFLKKKIPKENLRQYLFVKKDEEFQQKEKTLLDKENLKRKEKMKMDFNEINEFEKNVLTNIEKSQTENAERKKKLLIEWKERKSVLPTYISPKQEMVQEELRKEMEEEENKKERGFALNKKRFEFGYEIKNNMQPGINEKLKKQRTDLIKSLEDPKTVLRENLLFQRHKKEEELLNENNNKDDNIDNINKNLKKKIKIKINRSNAKLNNSINTYKRKKALSPIKIIYPLHPKPDGKIDYLLEMRVEKEKQKLKRNTLSNDNETKNKGNNLKWEKEIKSEKGTFIENVNFVKEKARIMDDELRKNQKMLDLYGGVKNNPNIAKKISNLLIDSIEAKLSILNKFDS